MVDFLVKFWERVKAVENCHAKFMKIAQSRQRTYPPVAVAAEAEATPFAPPRSSQTLGSDCDWRLMKV